MGLPWKPEADEQLLERFPKALERVFDVDRLVKDGAEDRPGVYPENVFDFQDGIRLIISKDHANGRTFLHISGSHQVQRLCVKMMLEEMVKKLVMFYGGELTAKIEASASKGGVIHLVIQLDENGKPMAIPRFRPDLN